MDELVPHSRAAKWLVGDRLSLVLHLGDGPLAYELVEQGHDVTIVSPDPLKRRHEGISYVRVAGERLPFRSLSFDVVVAPELDGTPSVLAEIARVLVSDGLLSTMARQHDVSIPWVRRLRQITGASGESLPAAGTFLASGLFFEAESQKFNAWEELDLAALMAFAESTRAPDVPVERLADVEELWFEYGRATGSLRLRHETECIRARVDKAALPSEPDPPDTVLIDFS